MGCKDDVCSASEPLVSVIVPTYNDSELLPNAVDSILAQTYSPIEIIVIDDGSEDGGATDEVVTQYKDKIRFIKTENRGVAAARNLGIDKANGEYIAFLDADDHFAPDKIQKQLAYMQENGCSFSHTSYNLQDEKTGALQFRSTKIRKTPAYPFILCSCGIATPTVMVNRKALGAMRFREDFNYAEDTCMWIDLAFRYDVGHLDEPLSCVVVGEETAAHTPHKQIEAFMNILDHIMNNPDYRRNLYEIEQLVNDMLAVNKARVNPTREERKEYRRKNKKWKNRFFGMFYLVFDFNEKVRQKRKMRKEK